MTLPFFLLLFPVAAAVLAGLLAVAALARGGGAIRPRTAADIALAVFGCITIAGVLGIGWLLIQLLRYDGWMAEEFALFGGAAAVLLVLTGGAYALRRRGRIAAALTTIAMGALPTAVVIAGLLYLQSAGMDMR